MKNLKSILVIPFFFYATQGYMKAFNLQDKGLLPKALVLIPFFVFMSLVFSDFTLFGNSDTDGLYTQIALLEFIYLVFGFGLNLFAHLAEKE
jgi:hypothetical protein